MVRTALSDLGWMLWRLLPGNPLVVRIVTGGSRRTEHLYLRAGYLVLLFFVLLISQYLQGMGSSLSELAKNSTHVFQFIAVLQLAMICLLAPVFAAGAISQEKDAETFNVLLTTPLTNLQIVLGSLAGRLFFIITLLLAGLPIFCITMLFGGVTGSQIMLSSAISVCTAIMTGAVAILISMIRVGTRSTVLSFYIGIAVYLGLGFVLGSWPVTWVPESIAPGSSKGMTWLTLVHPYWALTVTLDMVQAPDANMVGHYFWPANLLLPIPYYGYLLFCFLASLVMIVMATFVVRRGVKQGEVTWQQRAGRLLNRLRARGGTTRKPRLVWSNPVAWREAVTQDSVAGNRILRYGYIIAGSAAAAVFLFLYAVGEFGSAANARGWLSAIILSEFLLVVLMVTQAAATAITRERDNGTLELLLTTPLSSSDIIRGKLRGLVTFSVPLMAVPALTAILVAFWDLAISTQDPVVPFASCLLLPPLLMLYASVVCVRGLAISLTRQHSVNAIISAMGFFAIVAIVTGMIATGLAGSLPQIGALIAPLTFVTGVFYTLDPTWFVRRGFGISNALVLLAIGTLMAIGLLGAIVALNYRNMVGNFDMIIRRQSR